MHHKRTKVIGIQKYLRESCYHRIKCTTATLLTAFMWRRPLNSAALAITTHRTPKRVSDGIGTQVRAQIINKCRIKMVQRKSYIMWETSHEKGIGKIKREHCSNLNRTCDQFINGRPPQTVSPLISESLIRVWLSFNSVLAIVQLIKS